MGDGRVRPDDLPIHLGTAWPLLDACVLISDLNERKREGGKRKRGREGGRERERERVREGGRERENAVHCWLV